MVILSSRGMGRLVIAAVVVVVVVVVVLVDIDLGPVRFSCPLHSGSRSYMESHAGVALVDLTAPSSRL